MSLVAFSRCAQWTARRVSQKKKLRHLVVNAKRYVSMKGYPKTGVLICGWMVDNCFKRARRIMPYVGHAG
jgi:hypothetical protein